MIKVENNAQTAKDMLKQRLASAGYVEPIQSNIYSRQRPGSEKLEMHHVLVHLAVFPLLVRCLNENRKA